jgi:c-di-GMP-related signal transduction protein
VGMFSALDMLMHQPIDSILAKLPLSDAIKDAILHRRGLLGSALSCALAIENAKWSEIEFHNLDQEDMLEVYREGVQWTSNIIKSL